MNETIKAEIRLITKDGHPGEWQWMGRLTEEKLRELCDIADRLSDESTEGN